MTSYGEQVAGELRLMEAFGVYAELPDALRWVPRIPEVWPPRAPMLERISEASAAWNLRMGFRRIHRSLLAAFTAVSPEWDLFEEVA